MALLTPLWMQAQVGDTAIDYSALYFRQLIGAAFTEGVMSVAHLKVSQRAAGANFSVDVSAGVAAVNGADVADQGAYLCTSTTAENLAIPAPPGSGSRTHRVIARVKDKLHNGTDWSTYEWALEVLQDTGSGTQDTPASAISLALVTVVAGQPSVSDANIVDTRPRSSAGGATGPSYGILTDNMAAITGNVTPADTGLEFDLEPGLRYDINGTVIYAAGAGGLKLALAGPTGWGCDLSAIGPAPSVTASTTGDAQFKLLLASPFTAEFGGAGGGALVAVRLGGHAWSGVGGKVRLRAAQGALSATATQVMAQTMITATPLE